MTGTVIPIGRAVKAVINTAERRMKMVSMHAAAGRMHKALASAISIEHAMDRHEQVARSEQPFDRPSFDTVRETLTRALEIEMAVAGEAALECDKLCAELNLPHPFAAITGKAT